MVVKPARVLCSIVTMVFAHVAMSSVQPALAEDSVGTNAHKYAVEISEIERRGRLIFEKDRAAWVATDHFRASPNFNQDGNLVGWVTEAIGDDRFTVSFLALEGEQIVVRHSVDTKKGQVLTDTSQTTIPGREMTNRQRLMYNARRIAGTKEFTVCAENYNSVVLPSDNTTFYVYLLPALTSFAELPVGGHHRFLIDGEQDYSKGPDGDVIEKKSFTKSCQNLPLEDNMVAVFTTHMTAPFPEEPHVFLSLLSEIDIYVLTVDNKTTWLVSDGVITEAGLN